MINKNLSSLQDRSLDFFSRYFISNENVRPKRPMSATIKRQPEEVAALLSDIKNLPLFLENLEQVESLVNGGATWYFKSENEQSYSVKIPMITEFQRLEDGFVWASEDKVGFKYSVAIQLEKARANRGTIVRMMVLYDSLAGDLVGVFEKVFGNDAEILSKKNLQRLKAFCEIGHVPTTAGQPSGRDEDKPESMKH